MNAALSSIFSELDQLGPADLSLVADRLASLWSGKNNRHNSEHYLRTELYQRVARDPSIFEFLQAGSLDGIWYRDIENPAEEWLSPRLKEVFGYSDGEIPNTSTWWLENIFPEDLATALENFRQHCADERHPYDQLVRYRHKNGSTVWIRCRGIAFRDASGKPVRMLGVHTDVTAIKNAEERFRTIYEAAPEMVFKAEFRSGNILECNNMFARFTGHSQPTGTSFFHFCHPDSIAKLKGALEALQLGGRVDNLEVTLLRTGEFAVPTLLSAKSEPGGFRAWCRDISHVLRVPNVEILLEALPTGTLLVAADGIITSANSHAVGLFGYLRTQLIGLSVEQVLPSVLNSPKGAKPASGARELSARRRDGSLVLLQVALSPLQLAEGDFILASLSDLSERKAVEFALRESEYNLRQVTERLPQLIWTCTPTGECNYLSPQWVQYTGRSEADQMRDGWVGQIHPDDRATVLQKWTECVPEGRDYLVEFRLRRWDGEYRWFDSRGVPLRSTDGHILKWFGSSTDVNNRKEMEEAIVEREERFRNLAEAMPHMVCQVAPNGVPTFLNQRWIRYIGKTLAEATAGSLATIVHPDDLPAIRDLWIKTSVAHSTEHVEGCRVRLQGVDGSYRWFFDRIAAVYDAAGNLRHSISTCTDIEDWVKAEDSLRQSEEKFRLLADSIPQLAWMADASGSMFWFNRRWYDFTGCKPDDLAASGWEKFHHPGHIQRVREQLKRSWETGKDWEDILPLRGHDNSFRWFLSRALPLCDEEGRVVRWFGTHTDVTEQRQSEADQHFLLDLGKTIQASNDPVEIARLATRLIGKYLDVQRCGWFSVNQEKGQFTIEQEYADPDLPSHLGVHSLQILGGQTFNAALAQGRPMAIRDASIEAETRDTYHDNDWDMPRSMLVVPVIRDGKWLGAIGIAESRVHNWTDREIRLIRYSAERAWPAFEAAQANVLQRVILESLADREQRLLLTLHAAAIGTWDYNPFSERLLCDERCKIAFGFDTSVQITYAMLLNAIHLEDRTQVKAMINSGFNPSANGGGHVAFECRTVGAEDACVRHIVCNCQVFFDTSRLNGSAYRFLGVVQDFTKRKQSDDALRRANSELEQFAYAAAHDLQEPLRNVGLATQILSSRFKGTFDDGADTCLTIAVQGSIRMQAMVKDLLSYSRALDGFQRSQTITYSGEVLANVIENLRSAIAENDARITWDSMALVRMEPMHLTQILQNLIGNALKYVKPGQQPQVHVSTRHHDGECTFAVTDNGIGIHPDYQDRVFGVFRRLRQVDVPGTGIGLALCKRIVEHYGGKIWIESSAGAGSTFLFTVPAIERKRDAQTLDARTSSAMPVE